MPTPLPIIRGACTALYPFTQTYICNTGISDGQAATPSRWVKSPPLVKFEFPYLPVSKAQKNTLKAAYASALGQFATDRSATPGTEYDYLSFDSDEFEAVERTSGLYAVKWSLTQTLPQNWTPAASGAAYPVNSLGAICQLPYTQRVRYQTRVSKMASGPKYALAEFGGGLTNFPTTGLMGWEFADGMLNDAEVTTRVNHFLANWGRFAPFQFTDEDGTVYSNVYYGSDQLTIVRNMVNMSSVRTALVQMF